MHPFARLTGVALVLACAGCARQQPASSVDVKAERDNVQKIAHSFSSAVAERDTAAVVGWYSVDAQLLPPNEPMITGGRAIRDFWAGMLRTPSLTFSLDPMTTVVSSSGDLAVEVGRYQLGMDTPTGRVDDRGKYVTAFKKVNGGWRIFADTFNSDLPTD